MTSASKPSVATSPANVSPAPHEGAAPTAAVTTHASPFVGIDFGTTNSVVATVGQGARQTASVARHGPDRQDSSYRSLLCFWPDDDGAPGSIHWAAGPEAIEAFRTYGPESRLIQSVKSFVASTAFEKTVIFGQHYSIVDLISLLLRGLRKSAERDLGPLGHQALVGRPVTFVGQHANEKLALDRLTQAYRRIGFDTIDFVAEPLAAAHHYARSVDGQETCLVADFGGGTSDFTLLRIDGSTQRDAGSDGPRIDVIGQSGVGIAGDAFDQRIVQQVVCPALGLGSTYRGMSGQSLNVPSHYYEALSQWHRLSMMRTKQTLRELQEIRVTAAQPEPLARFMYLLDNELGFELYTAVTDAKAELSQHESAKFKFVAGPIDIDASITRADFEAWIAPELATLGRTVDAMFEQLGQSHAVVDRVFLTGGSSLIPAVRQLFADRFGAQRLSGGDEFFSIAAGLALAAHEAAM